mmetsp:Transcript_17480/g.22136  ORF Transcript_17480/g.22136 Transcript_17480/m.22136 type:complete len:139 (-) Transcript_17480:141-557(-)
MSGNKLSYMKSTRQNLREAISYQNNISMQQFEDRHRSMEKKGLPLKFKNNWAMLCHMQDLRLWTIAYAPSKQNNLQRLQELHRINNEALYQINNALYKRIIAGIFLWFLVNKMAKQRFLNNGAKDSHEVSFRDTTAHM